MDKVTATITTKLIHPEEERAFSDQYKPGGQVHVGEITNVSLIPVNGGVVGKIEFQAPSNALLPIYGRVKDAYPRGCVLHPQR